MIRDTLPSLSGERGRHQGPQEGHGGTDISGGNNKECKTTLQPLELDSDRLPLLSDDDTCSPMRCVDFGIQDYLSRIVPPSTEEEETEESEQSFPLDVSPPEIEDRNEFHDLKSSSIGLSSEDITDKMSSDIPEKMVPSIEVTTEVTVEQERCCCYCHRGPPGLSLFPTPGDMVGDSSTKEDQVATVVETNTELEGDDVDAPEEASNEGQGVLDDQKEDVEPQDGDDEELELEDVDEPIMSDLERRAQVLRMRTRFQKQDTNACLVAPPDFRIQGNSWS